MKTIFIRLIIFLCIISNYCFANYYSNIYIENDKSPSENIKLLLQSYENKNLTNEDLDILIEKLNEAYQKEGNIVSSIKIIPNLTENENLILRVERGRINKIITDRNYLLALSFHENDVISMKNIDQFVENLKTDLSEPIINIVPSNKENYYDIIIKTERKKMLNVSIRLDNNNYKDYGRENLHLTLGRDNIISSGDFLSFYLKERLVKNREAYKERLYNLSYSIPIKNWKINYSFSHEEVNNRILIGRYETKKKENIHSLELSRLLYRGATSKIDFFFGIKLKDTKNYFNNIKLDVSSKKHNSVVLGTRMLYYIKNGVFYIEPYFEKGIAWFGGEGNKNNSHVKSPFDKEFTKYNMNIYFNKNFFFTNYGYFNYTSNISATYSVDHLLDANKFEMGGVDSIRGFKENTIKGDKGFYMSNTLTFERKLFSPFIGLDFGLSRDYYRDEGDKLVGAALGVKFVKGDLTANLAFSKALVYAKDMPRENYPIYFKVSYHF